MLCLYGYKSINEGVGMGNDNLTEEELINLRGSLNLLCNKYEKRIRVEEYKAVDIVQRFIDRILGV